MSTSAVNHAASTALLGDEGGRSWCRRLNPTPVSTKTYFDLATKHRFAIDIHSCGSITSLRNISTPLATVPPGLRRNRGLAALTRRAVRPIRQRGAGANCATFQKELPEHHRPVSARPDSRPRRWRDGRGTDLRLKLLTVVFRRNLRGTRYVSPRSPEQTSVDPRLAEGL